MKRKRLFGTAAIKYLQDINERGGHAHLEPDDSIDAFICEYCNKNVAIFKTTCEDGCSHPLCKKCHDDMGHTRPD